jgi:hypothetical protein
MKIIHRITYPNPWWSNRRRMAGPEVAMTLDEILELVGPLDDSPGENTARDRSPADAPRTTHGASPRTPATRSRR